jgi:hypothetical protein
LESLVFCLCSSSPFTEAVFVKLIIISAEPENNVVDLKKNRSFSNVGFSSSSYLFATKTKMFKFIA